VGYLNHIIGYLEPYNGERYHLIEWHRGVETKTPKERFNCIDTCTHNVVERSLQYGRIGGKFSTRCYGILCGSKR
jgi:hypothetical protein